MLVHTVLEGLAASASMVIQLHSMMQLTPLDAPPAWPPVFEASFSEVYEGVPVAPSSGNWYYSYNSSKGGAIQWRVDHIEPQRNNFCGCVLPHATSTCQLFFAPDGMYVHFPAVEDLCCRLCTSESGCSPLKPDWLSGAHPTRSKDPDLIHGRECYQFCTPGAQFMDCMSYDAFGVPCRYSESWSPAPKWTIVHNLTFTSWALRLTDSSVFDLPKSCTAPCRRLFPACMSPN
ncbi:hypothetical protein H310_06250 [Aphanomyces invadans]|uniref:Uncharacterized protein n=1 Tax=Aphanomyces invadans TaxID=157072 RepID=A0A024U7M9_9STRA|nr:hypothetical protein H310_06250 [Aphanomyces invadans]ETW01618.1 hypothetical protein H310_06250 [Aphanomyces invadans]|eukprot:XP_008869466.1 hypothetical protein H310_06250 [Aphanomyces invadans]